MKIICIGRNYNNHVLELKNKTSDDMIFFLKPETAIILKNQPFFIPDFSKEIHHEIEVVIKINKTGKHIQEKFAHTYYHELTLGIDFTARDLQKNIKKNGEPWEKAKAFDGSAPVGRFIQKHDIQDIQNLNFKLTVNQEEKQSGNTKNMTYTIKQIISYISRFITLKKGDLIFTGTPAGVDKIKKGDFLEGFINNERIIDIKIK